MPALTLKFDGPPKTAKPGKGVKIKDGAYAFMQNEQGGYGFNNLGLFESRGETLMVDVTSDIPLTELGIREFKKLDPSIKKIDTLFITHQHMDHTFGASSKEFKDTKIICAESVDDYLADFPPASWLGRINGLTGPAAKQMGENLGNGGYFNFEGLTPITATQTFNGSLELKVGDEKVEIFEGKQSHSPSDSMVHVPGKGVVHLGDLVSKRRIQTLQHPGIANAIHNLGVAVKWGAETYIPGHGPLMTLQDVKDSHEHAQWVQDQARRRFDKGMTFEEATDEFVRSLPESPYKDWRGRVATYWAHKMMWAEWNGNMTEHMRRNFPKYQAKNWELKETWDKKYPGISK